MKMMKKQVKKRKWVILLGIVLLAVGMFSLLVGMKVVQINTLLAARYPVKGIDVSHYQGEIDWEKMKSYGMEFAYIKATEGSGYVDENFEENWREAEKAKLLCGAYHFFSFESEGKKQAEHFIKNVGDLKGRMIPVIDVEYYGKYAKMPPDIEKMKKELQDMVKRLEEKYGRKPMIYCTYSVYRRYIDGAFDEVPLWIRNVYYPPEDLGRKWTLWQYTDKAQLDGYNGDEKAIDCNVFQGEKEQLQDYIIR
ncbi:MAG: glycoside hydrolase family 25 protein [Eubacterium sp.]